MFCQNDCSDHGPAGQFWLLESALNMDRAGGKLPGLVLSQENACNITPKETPGRTPHMKGAGMLVGNFELNPQKESPPPGKEKHDLWKSYQVRLICG